MGCRKSHLNDWFYFVKNSDGPVYAIDLILYLARSGGQPRGQELIYREVWGKEFGDLSTVAVHIQRIRKKIEEDPAHPRWIKTAHGRGYFLNFEGGK